VLFALFSTSCLAFGQEAVFEEGVISTGDYESHPAFSITGDTLYFLKMAPDISTWTICTSIRTNNTWSSPVVAPFSGRFRDGDPFITQDGKEFYFVSNRSFSGDSTKRDLDIWRMRKTAQGWSQPMRLPEPINSAADEYYPTLTDQGVLYFSSERGGGDANIYRSVPLNGSYFSVHKMGNQINSEFNEYEPFIAHDESYMIFMSTRPNGLTHGDLYFSQRINGVWQKAIVLPPPFNSTGTEWSPSVSRDGKFVFFGSTRGRISHSDHAETIEELNQRINSAGNGLGDIYRVDFTVLKQLIKL
jgi:Tol biopolymer transport system component